MKLSLFSWKKTNPSVNRRQKLVVMLVSLVENITNPLKTYLGKKENLLPHVNQTQNDGYSCVQGYLEPYLRIPRRLCSLPFRFIFLMQFSLFYVVGNVCQNFFFHTSQISVNYQGGDCMIFLIPHWKVASGCPD